MSSPKRLVHLSLVPVGLLVASCTPATSDPGRPRRYSVALDYTEQAEGGGARAEHKVHVDADVVERHLPEGRSTMTLERVAATGDEAVAASARQLAGAAIVVGPRPGEVDLGARLLSGSYDAADAALLSQLLLTSAPDGKTTSGATSIFLPAGAGKVRIDVRQQVGEKTKVAGEPAREVSATATAKTQMALTAYKASSDGSNVYVAQAGLRGLVGAAPNQPFVTETTSRTVSRQEPYKVTIPGKPGGGGGPGFGEVIGGIFSDIFGALFCAFSVGLACPEPSPPLQSRPPTPPTPSRTETRYRSRTDTVRETRIVKGPSTLDVQLNGEVGITSTGAVSRKGGKLLRSTTTGHSSMLGQLPAGPGVPATLARTPLRVTSDWTVTKTLITAPRPAPQRGILLPGIALSMLLAVSTWLGLTQRHHHLKEAA